MPTFKDLQQESNRARHLWCIDRKPEEVDYDWIKRNAFEIEQSLDRTSRPHEIAAGSFILRQGKTPGKVWIGDASGKGGEVDGSVLEDLLKSVF
jgi:hypothetical protein